MKAISPKKYEAMPQEAKEDIAKIGKHLRSLAGKPYEFNRTLATICEKMYAEGIAAAFEGDVVEQGQCINISKGSKWYIDCPHCNHTLEIDLKQMLPEEEGYGVKV